MVYPDQLNAYLPVRAFPARIKITTANPADLMLTDGQE